MADLRADSGIASDSYKPFGDISRRPTKQKAGFRVLQMIDARYRSGKTTDYKNVMNLLGCTKTQAQNKLEYLHGKRKIVPLGYDEKHKKQYGPPEANRRNKPIPAPEHDYKTLLDCLRMASQKPVEIHNLELITTVSTEAYHELTEQYPPDPYNHQIIVPAKVNGQNIHAKISTTGTVEIKSRLSQSPFKLREEADVFKMAEKLGEWRREFIRKGLPETTPYPSDWILQKVDINKNVRIREDERKPELVLYLSMKQAYGAFTAYTKYMKATNEWELRIEENKTLYSNPKLTEACDGIIELKKREPLEVRAAKALTGHPESVGLVEGEIEEVEYPLRVNPEYRDEMESQNGVIRQSPQDERRFNINKRMDFVESVFWRNAPVVFTPRQAPLPENNKGDTA